MPFQFFYAFQRIDTTLWPMPDIRTSAKIRVTLQRGQYRIGMPVRTHAFPMIVNGDFDSINAGKTINAVPQVYRWLCRDILYIQSLGDVKFFLTAIHRFAAH